MGKGLKIILITIGVILLLGVIGAMVVQKMMTSKIEKFLSNDLPENLKLDYEHLDFSLINGNLTIDTINFTNFEKNTDSIIITVQTKHVVIDGISYWDYLVNDEINLQKIIIDQPDIQLFYHKAVKSKDSTPSKTKSLKQNIHVGTFQIDNSSFSMFNVENDSLMLKLKNFNLNLSDIDMDTSTMKQRIPFNFETYQISFADFFYSLNVYENLEIKNINVSKQKINYQHLNLYTKYSKEELSKMISTERDHVDLSIDDVAIHFEEFGYHNDSVFFFNSPKVEVLNPVLNIYRDKLVADDNTIKLLYSKMLRDLKFDLTLSEVSLKNGEIHYSERVKPGSDAGLISFTKLNADIKNLSNTYSDSIKTNIDIDAIFMKSTPIKVNWYFDVNHVNDHFIFKADMGALQAQNLNQFTEPNLKIKMEGEMTRTYFTIDGNFQNSNVDFRMNYEDFKVIILDKEGRNKNKFLSVVANLFIKKGSEKSLDDFREGSKASVERDKTKSVFNFIWLNAQAGLLSVMTGSGKK